MKKISQREAHRLRKKVATLVGQEEARRRVWGEEWFGGVNIATVTYDPAHAVLVAIQTARRLRHAVVVIGDDSGTLRFMALPLAKQ